MVVGILPCYFAVAFNATTKSYFNDMRPYFIFVIILIVVYIVYYAVTILFDLYGKKEEGKNEVEVFDIDGDDEDLPEETVSVSESDYGFSVGDSDYETATDPTAEHIAGEESVEDRANKQSVAEELKARTEERMEVVNPTFSNTCNAEDLNNLLLCKGVHNGEKKDWEIYRDRL